MKLNQPASSTHAWTWIPSLYFAEGLPYVAVMTIAVILYKNLGLSNTEIALYTSWLYLPWVIKPLWSPFVDIMRTRRWWIVGMQSLIAIALAGVAFTLNTDFWIQGSLAFFWLLAFSSATHDIAADGFYMLGLSEQQQSFFVGLRNTFYRFSMIFGQGAVVMLAGWLDQGVIWGNIQGNMQLSWSLTFLFMAGLMIAFTLYHAWVLPRPVSDTAHPERTVGQLLQDFLATFRSFFAKKHTGLALFFLLSYRLGESQLAKIASAFMLDKTSAGGLALSTTQVGQIYGTLGVAALMIGGILGGVVVARYGLKKWIIPMVLAINLPDLLYVFLAAYLPENLTLVAASVALEQLGYGFGFTAYTLFLIRFAEGEHRTAHYAIGTGLMALGMMLPGMIAGWLQEWMGYPLFFAWVCLCTLPGVLATYLIRRTL